MIEPRAIDLLSSEVEHMYAVLREYGYFMGDYWPAFVPWRSFEGKCEEMQAQVDPKLAEGALVLLLAVVWGARDGAHEISLADREGMRGMINALRVLSPGAECIATTIEMVQSSTSSDADCAAHSARVFERFVGEVRHA